MKQIYDILHEKSKFVTDGENQPQINSGNADFISPALNPENPRLKFSSAKDLIYDFNMTEEKSLQETYAPNGICFGCGVKNEKGLRIRSFPDGDDVVAEFRAEPHHQAFPGMLNGGIIGALLDCHSNWAAAYFLMKKAEKNEPDCTVTADFHVKLKRPTPFDATLYLRARVVESTGDKAIVEAELIANEKICATCRGTFAAVKEGHPAYHRW